MIWILRIEKIPIASAMILYGTFNHQARTQVQGRLRGIVGYCK